MEKSFLEMLPTLGVFGVAALRLKPTANILAGSLVTLRYHRDSIRRLNSDIIQIKKAKTFKNPISNKNTFLSMKSLEVLSCLYKLSKINFNELGSYNITKPLGLKLFNYMILYISVHLTDLTKLKSI